MGEEKAGKVSPLGKLRKLLFVFFSSLLSFYWITWMFSLILWQLFFYSKVSKGFLPTIRNQFVSRYRAGTPTAAADLLRLQFMFTCVRCETFFIVCVQKTTATSISFISSWRKGLHLLFSSCFSPLENCCLHFIRFFCSLSLAASTVLEELLHD